MSVYRRNGIGEWVKKDFETRNNFLEKKQESSYFDQQIILELREMNSFLKAQVKMLRLIIMGLTGALLGTIVAVWF